MAKHLKNTLLSSLIVLLIVIEAFSLRPFPTKTETSLLPHTLSGAIHVQPPPGMGLDALNWLSGPTSRTGIDFVVAVAPEKTLLEEKKIGYTDFFLESNVTTPAGDLFVFHSHGSHKHLKGGDLKTLVNAALETQTSPEGVFSIISHPSHVKNPWNRFDRFTEGIELVNLNSQWVRELYSSPFSFLGSLMVFPFNQFLAVAKLLQPFPKDFVSWDAMNSLTEGHFGVLGHDLPEAPSLIEGSPLHESLIEKSFRLARNVLILPTAPDPDFQARKKQIYEALKNGRIAIVFTVLYPFEGNDWAMDCEGKLSRSGDRTALGKSCTFNIKTPASFPFQKLFKLYRNGELVNEFSTQDPSMQIPVAEPGTYRLEVWAKTRTLFHFLLNDDTPYVLYNPIYIR